MKDQFDLKLFLHYKRNTKMKKDWDVVIVGGGPAGLTAALSLGRGGRSVLIFDDNKPRNAPASHMMNFPSRDGTPPSEFKRIILDDLQKYSDVKLEPKRVESLTKDENRFIINNEITAKKVIMAHGVIDIMAPIPGAKELWGKSIFHCPYCHGYEHKNEPMGIIGGGMAASHYGALLKGLTSNLILFTNGESIENESDIIRNGIKIYSQKIEKFLYEGETLLGVKLSDGEFIERSYLFYRPEQKLTTDLGTNLGCILNELGHYKIDESGMTSVEGIYAAGDIAEPRQAVLMACAQGMKVGTSINYSLAHNVFQHS